VRPSSAAAVFTPRDGRFPSNADRHLMFAPREERFEVGHKLRHELAFEINLPKIGRR